MSALVQQSEEWFSKRRTMIGASDAPVIMGVSPWNTPHKLWQEKLQLVEGKKTTKRMQDGLDIEEQARSEFFLDTGLIVKPSVAFHESNPFMMASLDGMTDDKKFIVEIKNAGKVDHSIAMQGQVPEKYYPQLQHQLEVCELEMVYYYSFRSKDDKKLLKVHRDDKYIKRMIALEKEFWECLNDFIAPKLIDRDYELMENDIWHAIASEWISVSTNIKELEKKESHLRELLISQSQNRNSRGSGLKICKILKKGNIDYSKIPELKQVNLEKYRKDPVEFWKILQE